MMGKDNRFVGIRFLGIYNIVLGLLSLSVLPVTIFFSRKVKSVHIESSLLIWGLLPLVLLSVFYVICGISVLKLKEWGRKCLIVASALQALMGLYLTVEDIVSPAGRSFFINYILLVIGAWAIYYLRKPEVRNSLRER